MAWPSLSADAMDGKEIPYLLRGIGPEAGGEGNQEQRAARHFKSCSWR